jgi:hypothetical protein
MYIFGWLVVVVAALIATFYTFIAAQMAFLAGWITPFVPIGLLIITIVLWVVVYNTIPFTITMKALPICC